MKSKAWILVLCLLLPSPLSASDDEYDLELGEEIYDTCAPCHGPFGQGGGGGVYPRVAGMNMDYIIRQLDRFKTRKRENIPMIPYANERELPDDDVEAVSAYIETLKLKTRLPKIEGVIDGLTRLKQAKQVLNIPRHPGDEALGAKIYAEQCAKCHGKRGEGAARGVLLAGQHIRYLVKRFETFRMPDSPHKNSDTLFAPMSSVEIEGILAFLSLQDDHAEE